MNFKWPLVLWSLLLIPTAVAAYVLLHRKSAGYAQRFTSPHMMPNVVPARPGWRRHLPVGLYLIAMAALLIGLARPQAAFSVPRDRATVMLVMDSSNSMKAKDVEPTRLQAAQAAAESFLDRLPSRFQVGVVGFAARAQIMNRPTADRVAVRRAIHALELQNGTAIGEGIARALQTRPAPDAQLSIKRRPPMVLLVLSDGRNTTGVDPEVAARRARRLGVRVYTIALGRRDTTTPNEWPRPPNFDMLANIARTTGGQFFSAPTSAKLEAVYQDLGSSIFLVLEEREVTVAFVGAGLLLLLVGALFSSLWFNRFP